MSRYSFVAKVLQLPDTFIEGCAKIPSDNENSRKAASRKFPEVVPAWLLVLPKNESGRIE